MTKKYYGIGVFIAFLIACIGLSLTRAANVNNTVNGKELPVYSVETDEKKVALSFDAAWGDVRGGLC